jgi:hypothetical protein
MQILHPANVADAFFRHLAGARKRVLLLIVSGRRLADLRGPLAGLERWCECGVVA